MKISRLPFVGVLKSNCLYIPTELHHQRSQIYKHKNDVFEYVQLFMGANDCTKNSSRICQKQV